MKIWKITGKIIIWGLVLTLAACQEEENGDEPLPEVNIENISHGELIPNQYIVELEPDEDTEQELAQATSANARKAIMERRANRLINRLGARRTEILGTYSGNMRGFIARMTQAELESLRQDPAVKRIIPDRLFRLAFFDLRDRSTTQQIVPWGIERVGGAGDGSGRTAWIIDTGIDLDHPDLNVDENRSRSFLSGIGLSDSPNDFNGHGTHVAGTVAAKDNELGVIGVAADANVVAVRVLNRFGAGSWSNIIEGMDYVAQAGAPGDVCNMSLGGGSDELIDDALRQAAESGVIFCVAAGNESQNVDNVSPARVDAPNVYTISAMDDEDRFAAFSNFGAGIDYCAPGVEIAATWSNGLYRVISGTSMAAPHVAGLLLLHPEIATDGFVQDDPDNDPDPIAFQAP